MPSEFFELTDAEFDLLYAVPHCGCGQPDTVLDLYRSVLRATPPHDRPKDYDWPGWDDRLASADNDERLFYVVAYVLDHMRATEHGGSVDGAWRTEKGDSLLDLLDRYAEDYDRIPCITPTEEQKEGTVTRCP